MKNVSESIEDYLEAIVMLGGTEQNPVNGVDIAELLGVSKASVTKATSTMKKLGFVQQEHYGPIVLTAQGWAHARSVYERHELLTNFLTKHVGIPEDCAKREACKMEHAISDESFAYWRAFIEKL